MVSITGQLFIKKGIGLCSLTIILMLHQGCRSSQRIEGAGATKEISSLYTNTPITVDAQLNEDEWKYAKEIIKRGNTPGNKNKIFVKTLWDEQNLYMAYEVQDEDLRAIQTARDHPQISKDDIVEFLIDARNDKDSCWTTDDVIYHINLLNQVKDDRGTVDCKSDWRWNGKAKTAVRLLGTLNDSTDIDTGYIVEVAISWEELDIKPSPGFKAGINFANSNSGVFIDWVGAWPFRSPFAFGNLVLKKIRNGSKVKL